MSEMGQADTIVKQDILVKKPAMWKVILLNDNFTPVEFVLAVLTDLFNKSQKEAYEITMKVHNHGKGVAGIYTKEIAEQKITDAHITAKKHSHPLKLIMEKA